MSYNTKILIKTLVGVALSLAAVWCASYVLVEMDGAEKWYGLPVVFTAGIALVVGVALTFP